MEAACAPPGPRGAIGRSSCRPSSTPTRWPPTSARGLDAEMYRFFDRHGRTLALRPDMTIPTARVVGTRLYDQPMPLRISYVGSVFRYEPPRAGPPARVHPGRRRADRRARAARPMPSRLRWPSRRCAPSACPRFASRSATSASFAGCWLALALPERLAARLRSAVDRKAEAELAALLPGSAAACRRRA